METGVGIIESFQSIDTGTPYCDEDGKSCASEETIWYDAVEDEDLDDGLSPYSRVLVYRDYSGGHGMKFSEEIPPLLMKKMGVEEWVWKRTLEGINKICKETDVVNKKTFAENVRGFCGYFICFPSKKTQYGKTMDRLSAYIHHENHNVYDRLGLKLNDPKLNGYRYIEVLIKYLAIRTTMPVLHWGTDFPKDPKLEAWQLDTWLDEP